MKIKIIFIIVACLGMWQACYEDKGDYDYKPFNKVTLRLMPTSTRAIVGEVYSFMPEVTFADSTDTTGFEYWWEYVSGFDDAPLICEGRELNFIAPKMGSHRVQLCVKELKTGVITMASLSLQGVISSSLGWLLLSEDNGKSVLSFIRPGWSGIERIYTPFIDIYSQKHPDVPLGNKPERLTTCYNNETCKVMIIQEQEAIWLDAITFEREVTLSEEFSPHAPEGFVASRLVETGWVGVVQGKDGKIYSRPYSTYPAFIFYDAEYSNLPVSYAGTELKVDRLWGSLPFLSGILGLHEKEKKRMLWLLIDYFGKGEVINTAMPAGDYLDYNNLGDADIYYSEAYNASGATGYTITIYEKDGKMYIQRFKNARSGETTVTLSVSNMSNRRFAGEGIVTKDTKFFKSGRARSCLFFAEKNVLYWTDVEADPAVVKVIYTFPEGERVVDMDTNPMESELGVLLESGKFVTLNIVRDNILRNYEGVEVKIGEVTIPGKMIDLEYKYTHNTERLSRDYTKD